MKNLELTEREWLIVDATDELIDVAIEYTVTFDENDAMKYPELIVGKKGWALMLGDMFCDSLILLSTEPTTSFIEEFIQKSVIDDLKVELVTEDPDFFIDD